MAHGKESEGVDFLIESKPLTDEERKAISEFIKKDKEKRKVGDVEPIKLAAKNRREA